MKQVDAMGAQQSRLLAVNREFASIVSEARGVGAAVRAGGAANTVGADGGGDPVALLFNPAQLYGRAAAKLRAGIGPDNDTETHTDIARGIRMTAAKIRAGDRAYIFEALTGQSCWLQALALQLGEAATREPDYGRKVGLGRMLLKVQAAAAKTLATVSGLSALEGR